MNHPCQCSPLGDSALLLSFGNQISPQINQKVHAAAERLRQARLDSVIELVPAYTTLTVYYDPCRITSGQPYEMIKEQVLNRLQNLESKKVGTGKLIEIPTCYDKEFAPDLEQVAKHCQLSPEEVIGLHTSATYDVYFLGFAPGFPFLGGMNKKLATPRLENPRQKIPAGSVGIAGEQTGVYPLATPGGWQLIGHTPISLVDFEKESPTLLKPGDKIRFKAISRSEHQEMETLR
ncbi:5-oxoprolinase subunit PxpB [Endozoicomonas arenosclerae]|uniref:5-oxoprolinase subunit PxpB n=1 Tax=Endozoicomonas arenosclerae TaxID=1633495 RepID=UPI000783BE2D|nr:5-oxoprolinase subunit PxpB [Endozoicomonas arenosclerae]